MCFIIFVWLYGLKPVHLLSMRFLFQFAALLSLTILVRGQQTSAFHLKDGDRAVFYGDSITDQRLYTTFVETYVVTRFPSLNVRFVHSGWGGDRVGGGGGGPIDVRLQRDVFAYKPTVMTVMLGMNDASYRKFDEAIFEKYRTGYEHIVDSMKMNLPGIRLTLIQPSPYDDVTRPVRIEGGYNNVLKRYGLFVKELAERERLAPVADLNGPVVAALEKARMKNPELSQKIIPDYVHPAASGHLLMAAELLKTWHAPAIVTAVEINTSARKVTRSENSKVTQLEGDAQWSWNQTDAALPMPVDTNDAVMALAVNSSDFESSLNQQPLKVTGLKEGTYSLRIDGTEIGKFANDELAKGLNLAFLPTPMFKQAQEVHRLTLQHNDVHFVRWRQVQLRVTNADQAALQGALDALDSLEDDLVKKQRAAAQPVERKYELVPMRKD
jgi:lysophospholipase L1-like esterase